MPGETKGCTAQKMKFFVKDFFSKCDQMDRLLKKSLMENFIFCAVMLRHFSYMKKVIFLRHVLM